MPNRWSQKDEEKPSPATVRSTSQTTKETKAVSEMSTEIGTMISVSSTEYGTNEGKQQAVITKSADESQV